MGEWVILIGLIIVAFSIDGLKRALLAAQVQQFMMEGFRLKVKIETMKLQGDQQKLIAETVLTPQYEEFEAFVKEGMKKLGVSSSEEKEEKDH